MNVVSNEQVSNVVISNELVSNCLHTVFFRQHISVICPTIVLKPVVTVFTSRELKSGTPFWVGPGSGLSLSNCFGPISGLHTKLFSDIQIVSIFSFVMYNCCAHRVTSVSEVIVTFFQLILFANTAAFFCSSLGLVLHSF